MEKKYKLLTAGLSLLVVVSAALAAYLYRAEQQEKVAVQQQAIEEGISLYQQAKYPEALQALESVPEGSGQDWRLPYYKGATLVRLKDYEPAAIQLEKAKNLNSSDPQILYLLGVVYYKLGKLELAEGYFAATLELDPSHEHARGLLGVMINLQRQQDPAGDSGDTTEETPEEGF